ncbi:MAG TPA: protein kinase, partial [Egibacteraceae bacterium]|nr:protein kinase [Egibacteraceae bacterium]
MTSEAGMAELIRDRYQPLELVGGGGQGQVLRAVDRWHARQVALKVRAAGWPDQRAALLAEARILLGLEPHPGLPLVREDFFVGDRYYLVMDWVDGTSLQRVLDERGDPGLPFPTVLGWLDQVAAALDHLHRHEPPIVHQDVKPANLVLDARRRVVLVDFGISAPAGHARPTPVGSAGYTAPELAAGGPATPAADVYSLGATAFALLTGAPPRGGPLRWHGLRQAEAGAAERALRRALSTDPAQRPGSAGELVERLRAWLEPSLPSGTVTFLLIDVDQAGRLWEQHPAAMQQALARQDAVLADTVERHRGALVGARVEDDSVLAVFARATDALACALALGRASGPWPGGGGSALRMALHCGEAEPRHGRYPGGTAKRCAALRTLAGGGEILLSQAAHDLVVDALPADARLDDLGSRRLEGLDRPERVFRLEHPRLPPPASGPRTEPLPRLAGGPPAADRAPRPVRPRRRRRRRAGGLLVTALAALALVAALSVPLAGDRQPAAQP